MVVSFFQLLLKPPSRPVHERLDVRRREIEQLPPGCHEVAIAEAEPNPSTMKTRATVALLICEVVGIVGIHGVADQQSTRHCHRSELSQQLARRLPVPGEDEFR